MDSPKMKMFIECTLPMTNCNMRCEYCYVPLHQTGKEVIPDLSECVNKAEKAFSVERLGGICMINICAAGETLLHPQLFQIVNTLLLVGHYVMIVTNGTLTGRLKEYCNLDKKLKNRLFFKISMHYLELRRINKLDKFCENVNMLKNAGISYTIELTPDDSYLPFIDEIKEFCMNKFGELCHVTVPRDERIPNYPLMTSLERDEFKKIWQQFNSTLFDYKYSIFEVKRMEYCYAGKWGIVLNLLSGDYYQCYQGEKLGNIFLNIDEPLNLRAIGNKCKEGHCYNGHAFLGFGLIPELDAPTFDQMRNRITESGESWLSESMEEFMKCKLKDNNEYDSFIVKKKSNMINEVKNIRHKIGIVKRKIEEKF